MGKTLASLGELYNHWPMTDDNRIPVFIERAPPRPDLPVLSVEAEPVLSFSENTALGTFVTAAPNADGGATFLFEERSADEDRRVRIESGIGSIPTSRTPQDRRYTLIEATAGSGIRSIQLEPVGLALDLVGRLSDGRFIAASSRCEYTPDGGVKNMLVLSADGAVLDQFVAGDGISDLVIDSQDQIWIGYFDEGVFGNLGWGWPTTAEPLGACGVRVVNSHGEEVWRHANVDPFFIADVYAMASVEDGIAVCANGADDVVLLSRHDPAARLGAQWREARSYAFSLNSSWLMTIDHREGARLVRREPNGVRAVAQLRFAQACSGVWSGRGSRLNHLDASGWSYIDLEHVSDQFAQLV